MNKIFVFDLDDTLFPTSLLKYQLSIIQKENIQTYQELANNYQSIISNDLNLINLLDDIKLPKFILTNACYAHVFACLKALGISKYINAVIDRTIGQRLYNNVNIFLKPYPLCYYFTQCYIKKYLEMKNINNYTIIFFDDQIINLLIPYKLGWTTVYIGKSNTNNYSYVQFSFTNIYDALSFFNQ